MYSIWHHKLSGTNCKSLGIYDVLFLKRILL